MGEDIKIRYYRIAMTWWDYVKRHLSENRDEAFWIDCVDDIKKTVQESRPEDMALLTKMLNAVIGDMQENDKNGKGK